MPLHDLPTRSPDGDDVETLALLVQGRESVPHWRMDAMSVCEWLHSRQLDAASLASLGADDVAMSSLRECMRWTSPNPAALYLWDAMGEQQFCTRVTKLLTAENLVCVADAMLALCQGAEVVARQMQVTTFAGRQRQIWMRLARVEGGGAVSVSALDLALSQDPLSELEGRERFLSAAIRAVPDVMFIHDFVLGRTFFLNARLSELLGYDDEQLEPWARQLFAPIMHPDDVYTPERVAQVRHTVAQGEVHQRRLRMRASSGEYRHYVCRTAALEMGPDGEVRKSVTVARDVTDEIEIRERLQEEEQRYRLLVDSLSDLVIGTDRELNIRFVSPAMREVLGWVPAELLRDCGAAGWARLGLSALRDELAWDWPSLVLAPRQWELDMLRADGSHVPMELKCSAISDAKGMAQGLLLVCRDVSLRRQLDKQQRLAAKVFENSLEGIYITDAQGVISQVNPAFSEITGYSREEALGRRPNFLTSGQNAGAFMQAIQPTLMEQGHWQGELFNRRCDGELFPAWVSITSVRNSRGTLLGHITSFRDISESKNTEERIRHLAYYDPLTGLPNRSLFMDRLQQEMARAQRLGCCVALLFLDLDGFKAINDSMGHLAGDQLLKMVAERLQGVLRAEDTVARMGGDEFTIILGRLPDQPAAMEAGSSIASKILRAFVNGFQLPAGEVFVTPSVGVAFYPQDGLDSTDLLKNADTAMYHAKSSGKNNYQFYAESMNALSLERLALKNQLHQAVRDQSLELLFQPIHGFTSGGAVALEALLRWHHPERGLLGAHEFLPLAEESGLMLQIGDWALREACRQLAAWHAAGVVVPRLSVNVARRQLMDEGMVRSVLSSLDDAGIPARCLELDLTEDALMGDASYAQGLLQDLASVGVRVAVDNFGTGFSSLIYLKQLPLHALKVDRRFVADLPHSEEACRIVEAVVSLARSFGLEVIAQGVETREQAEWLAAAGVVEAQGYYFGGPLRADEVPGLFRAV